MYGYGSAIEAVKNITMMNGQRGCLAIQAIGLEVVKMKTLEHAYQDFDFEKLIDEQLIGSAQQINAYIECCQRYIGQQKIALHWRCSH